MKTLEPLLPDTTYQSASMSPNAQAADIIHVPSDIKTSGRDSAFNSYPPTIPLDIESNELGLFNGADMAYDIPSSSLNQDGYANMSTSDNLAAFATSKYEHAIPLEHMRSYQSATKNESSPYPDFEHSSGVRGVRAWATPTDMNMQLCNLDFVSFNNPRISNAQDIDFAPHGKPTKQASSFKSHGNHACGGSTTRHPGERSMGNTFSNPPVMDVQTTPQPLDPASVYGLSHYRQMNLVSSTLDSRTLPFDDPLTPGTLVGDDQSQLSESRPSVLNVAVQQMAHSAGTSPVTLVC